MGTIILWHRYFGTREIYDRDKYGRLVLSSQINKRMLKQNKDPRSIRYEIYRGDYTCLELLSRWSL